MAFTPEASTVTHSGNRVRIQLEVELSGTMLDMETSILEGCNQVGRIATEEALKRFDTDGSQGNRA